MKRKVLLVIAVLVTALTCLFTSCSNSVEPPRAEEYGYVTFGNGSSRSLSTEYGIKSYDDLNWFYTSHKMDSYGLTGETDTKTAVPAKSNGKGIGSGSVGPFSQGAWQFTLYAYETTETARTLVYQGTSSTVVLKGGETKAVPVSVSLMGETGVIDLSRAYFQWKDPLATSVGDVYAEFNLVGETDAEGDDTLNATTVVGPIKASESYKIGSLLSVNGSTDVPTGYYTCTVKAYLGKDVTTDESGVHHVSVEADPVVTQIFGVRVYGNATTYIKDNLVESPDTYVEFSVPDQTMVAFNSNLAEVPLTPAGATSGESGETLKTTVDFGSNLDNSATHILSVDITDFSTSTSKFVVESDERISVAGISLTLNAVKQVDGVTVQEEVSDFSDEPVIITTYVAKGLSNVNIRYNGNETAGQISPEYVSYNASTGELKFKAYHFSEYYAVADSFDAINESTNWTYKYLSDAVSNATTGDSIVLYRDVNLNSTVVVNKGLSINLNGYSINGNKVRAIQFAVGDSVITGNGVISSDVENVASSVIRIGDNNASENVSVKIEEGVIISTDSAYGITVFGAKNEILKVYGKVVSNAPANTAFDGCSISTVGTDTTQSTIYIYNGAEVSAANSNGIYMPSGCLYVYGGTITGTTGIYIKSGKTTISDGKIVGYGPSNAYDYFGNGGKSTGDALVVDSCGYPQGKPSVSVTGGTFVSENARAVASYNTEGNELVTGFITGGSFSTFPDCKKNMYKAIKTSGMYKVSYCSSHSLVDGTCEYCGYEFFAGGSGTESNPYLISTKTHFNNIRYAYSNNHFKLVDDISVSGSYYYGWYCATPYLNDSVFDGNNHTISVVNAARDVNLFYKVENSTIKNLNVVLDYSLATYMQGRVDIDNVNVSGEFTVTGNEGAYVVYAFTDELTFKNCTANVKMYGNSYNAVFVGYVNWGADVTNTIKFINCENKGTLVCNYASMFIGNPNAYHVKCVVENCKNSGVIQALNTNTVFNYYYAVTSNCYKEFIINDVVYADIADGKSSAPSCFEDTTVITTGQAIQGPSNVDLGITQNQDGNFVITEASIPDKTVDHYTVYVGVYATLKAGGSSRNYVTETISASKDSKVTELKNLSFVDTDWVKEHRDAVKGELAGNTIYTLGSESYYMLVTPDTDTLNGKVKAPQMIYVVAYDSDNKPLATARLLGNIS